MTSNEEINLMWARSAAERFDVVHMHNLVPLLTGAAYDACRAHVVDHYFHGGNGAGICDAEFAELAETGVGPEGNESA